MRFVTVSELRKKATQIVSEIETKGEEIVITKRGKPTVLMQKVSNGDFALNVSERKGAEHGKGNL